MVDITSGAVYPCLPYDTPVLIAVTKPAPPAPKKKTATRKRAAGVGDSGKDRRKAARTRGTLLDAAESLFVQRGYYGTSLRDISRAAEAPVALSYYHFGSKEDLFRAVIDRRADDNVTSLRAALDQVVSASGDQPPAPEDVLRAFIAPVVEHSMRGGKGWRNYIRLLAQVANLPQEESFLLPVNVHYDSVVREFVNQLQRVFPDMPAADVHWSFYFYQAAITHILIEAGVVDRQSGGLCKSSDLDIIVEKMTRFFAAGLRGMAPDP